MRALRRRVGAASLFVFLPLLGGLPARSDVAGLEANTDRPALSPQEARRRAAQSLLERARELEENYHFQEAFEVYERAQSGSGPHGDIAEAEIGAARCLHRWADLETSLKLYGGLPKKPGERSAPPDDSLARLEAAAKHWAGTPQEPKVIEALARRESDLEPSDVPSLPQRIRSHREQALAGFQRLAVGTSSTPEAAEATLGAARCLTSLDRDDDARSLLESAAVRFKAPRDHARIVLALARHYDVERKLELYRKLAAESSGIPEEAEAVYLQAIALQGLGREDEALRIYEEVASRFDGTRWAAQSLSRLGLYYLEREDRDRARTYCQRLAQYPADWSDVETNMLKDLDRYIFSPLYDKVRHRIEQLLHGSLHLNDIHAGLLSTAATPYICRIAALVVCLLLLPLATKVAPPIHSGAVLLDRRWSVSRISLCLIGWWTAETVLTVGLSLWSPTWVLSLSWKWDLASSLLTGGAVLLVFLWREPMGRVLGLRWGSLRRTALVLARGLLAMLTAWTVVAVTYTWLIATGRAAPATHVVSPGLSANRSWLLAAPYYLFMALTEEAVFRGVVHQALKTWVSPWVAAVLGSFLFSQFHLYALWSSMIVFAAGLVLVWIVERTRSLLPGTLLHAVCNLLLFALKRLR